MSRVLNQLKKEELYIKTPAGNVVKITKLDFTHDLYKNKQRGKLTLEQYYLSNKKTIDDTWEQAVIHTSKQVAKNNQWHNKLKIAIKYWFYRQIGLFYIKAVKPVKGFLSGLFK